MTDDVVRLKRRTPGERKAFNDGFRQAVKLIRSEICYSQELSSESAGVLTNYFNRLLTYKDQLELYGEESP